MPERLECLTLGLGHRGVEVGAQPLQPIQINSDANPLHHGQRPGQRQFDLLQQRRTALHLQLGLQLLRQVDHRTGSNHGISGRTVVEVESRL